MHYYVGFGAQAKYSILRCGQCKPNIRTRVKLNELVPGSEPMLRQMSA